MHERNVMRRAAISGGMWAVIAILMMLIIAGGRDSVGRITWGLRGGVLIAPFIGMAMGLCRRLFRDAGFAGRIGISLVTLYVAAFLFMVTALLTAFAAGELHRASLSKVLFDSWNLAIAGLTWTGFVVVLGPVAFLNHLWISRIGHGGAPIDASRTP